MPAYNQAHYIAEAIQSVRQQHFKDWELVIVDDGSTDATASIVKSFTDPRIRYLYQMNQGVSSARNTGIEAAQGEYIAFLDADDLFLDNKLSLQVSYLDIHPEAGLIYAGRIEIDETGREVGIFIPPEQATLTTLVLSFPFAPTDSIIRRSWLREVGIFSTAFVVNEDRDLYIRLALAGCHCVGLEDILSCRRLDTRKTFRDLPGRLDDMLRSLQTAFADERCPQDTLAVCDLAHGIIYLSWAYQASIQGVTKLAHSYFQEWLRYCQPWSKLRAHQLIDYLIHAATRDGGDHENRLRQAFAQLPPELAEMLPYTQSAIATGYLKRGMSSLLWGRVEEGNRHFEQARRFGARLTEEIIQELTQHLLGYESVYGRVSTEAALRRLKPYLTRLGNITDSRKLRASLAINRAFKAYRQRRYQDVPSAVLHGLAENYRYVTNRGVAAIFFRSLARMLGMGVI
jgi:glycosyltransferase involved in cell wall biosynthesis